MKKEFTEQEKQWLIDNYPTTKQSECAKHLMVSDTVIIRLVKELGLKKIRKPGIIGKKSEKKKLLGIFDGQKGYCIDCIYYEVGGKCLRTGKDTGALNRKVCFKDNIS